MRVLGIETSCDETAAAVYDGQAVPADSMIPPASQDGRAADAVIAKYPYDLRRAE